MDQTSGFAATLSIGQPLLQRLLRALWNAKQFSQTISASYDGIDASLFLDIPVITVTWSDPTHVALDLSAWGPLSITPPGGTAESRRVTFRARLTVALKIAIQAGQLNFGFDSTDFTVSNLVIDPYAGGPFSQASLDYLASPAFQSGLQLGLAAQLNLLGSQIPAIDLSSLGTLTSDPSVTVRHILREGAIVIGIDIDTVDADGNRITTVGNATQLDDATNGYDIAVWTNPVAVPIAYSFVRDSINTTVGEYHATLDKFQLTVEEGKFAISGSASRTGGSLDFSLDSVPKLVRPGVHVEYDEEYGGHVEYNTRPVDELWFDAQNVYVNVKLDWWDALAADIVSAITFDIGGFAVLAYMDMIRGNVVSGIDQNSLNQNSALSQQFTFGGVQRPLLEQKLQTFECHADGVYVGVTIKADFWDGSLDGPASITAEEALAHFVNFSIGLPADASTADPEIRILRTVRRTDTNQILISNTTTATTSTLTLTHFQVPFLDVDKVSIEVRVYRAIGTTSTDLFYAIRYLNVVDYVDRSHKYIQWKHESFVPVVRVESNGSHTVLGNQIVHRQSNIHRTALPGRCRMLRYYSTQKFGDVDGYPPVYTDDLPFQLSDILANRAVLCDYCFFGGPTRSVPLIPIP